METTYELRAKLKYAKNITGYKKKLINVKGLQVLEIYIISIYISII